MDNGALFYLKTLGALLRLIFELCEIGNDTVAWNYHLLAKLDPLLGADFGTAYVFGRSLDPLNFEKRLYVEHNLDPAWQQYLQEKGVVEQPHTPAIMARLGTDFTVTRQALIDDEIWYGSQFYREVASQIGWDQLICSQVFVEPLGMVHGLGLARRVGGAPFGAREVAMLRFFHGELAHLWRKPESVEIDSLPKRLTETIGGMRRGLSRKEIAAELDISPHTVHSYERQLFERFGVKSRGELLARLARTIRPTLPK
jgi:hypothetical protein